MRFQEARQEVWSTAAALREESRGGRDRPASYELYLFLPSTRTCTRRARSFWNVVVAFEEDVGLVSPGSSTQGSARAEAYTRRGGSLALSRGVAVGLLYPLGIVRGASDAYGGVPAVGASHG